MKSLVVLLRRLGTLHTCSNRRCNLNLLASYWKFDCVIYDVWKISHVDLRAEAFDFKMVKAKIDFRLFSSIRDILKNFF